MDCMTVFFSELHNAHQLLGDPRNLGLRSILKKQSLENPNIG
jgi:hypothetical protein